MTYRYQTRAGHHARSNWGDGPEVSEWGEGDVVWILSTSPAFTRQTRRSRGGTRKQRTSPRIPHAWSEHPELSPRGGKYRVVSVVSIGEGPEWCYRVAPMDGRKTYWDEVSDRLHVIPGLCDYTEGWLLIERRKP